MKKIDKAFSSHYFYMNKLIDKKTIDKAIRGLLVFMFIFTNLNSAVLAGIEAPTRPTLNVERPVAPTSPELEDKEEIFDDALASVSREDNSDDEDGNSEYLENISAPESISYEDAVSNMEALIQAQEDRQLEQDALSEAGEEVEILTEYATSLPSQPSASLSTNSNPNNDITGGISAQNENVAADSGITTGDASAGSHVSNFGSVNVADLDEDGGQSVEIVNSGNGSDSTNDASVILDDNDIIFQDNESVIVNDVEHIASTGDNSTDKNTGGDNTITTGDAHATTTIINSVNTNVAAISQSEFNVAEDYTGDLVLDFASNCISNCGVFNPSATSSIAISNQGNGAGSDNDLDVVINDNDEINQNNLAEIENNVVLVADTGNNSSSKNTGGNNTITTGDASTSATVFNFANNNFAGNVILGVVNIYGDYEGDIILPDMNFSSPVIASNDVVIDSSENGAGSTNTSNIAQNDNTEIIQTNTAMIDNNVDVVLTTGNNSNNQNTGGDALIHTGDTSAEVNVTNIANTNVVGGDWWLVLVNEAGNWVGHIMGSNDGSNMSGSTGTVVGLNQDGEVTLINKGNGTDSNNSLNYEENHNTEINQNNDAKITNNLELIANTGNNESNSNTAGDSSIYTGDAKAVVNIVNFVNNNFVGTGRLFLTMINVYGSWLGNFYGPNQKKQEAQTLALENVGAAAINPNSMASDFSDDFDDEENSEDDEVDPVYVNSSDSDLVSSKATTNYPTVLTGGSSTEIDILTDSAVQLSDKYSKPKKVPSGIALASDGIEMATEMNYMNLIIGFVILLLVAGTKRFLIRSKI